MWTIKPMEKQGLSTKTGNTKKNHFRAGITCTVLSVVGFKDRMHLINTVGPFAISQMGQSAHIGILVQINMIWVISGTIYCPIFPFEHMISFAIAFQFLRHLPHVSIVLYLEPRTERPMGCGIFTTSLFIPSLVMKRWLVVGVVIKLVSNRFVKSAGLRIIILSYWLGSKSW